MNSKRTSKPMRSSFVLTSGLLRLCTRCRDLPSCQSSKHIRFLCCAVACVRARHRVKDLLKGRFHLSPPPPFLVLWDHVDECVQKRSLGENLLTRIIVLLCTKSVGPLGSSLYAKSFRWVVIFSVHVYVTEDHSVVTIAFNFRIILGAEKSTW
jgi:hypothetical protein